MTTNKIKCSRCGGTGNVGGPVVHSGAPGTCFNCDGTGEVYKDKFFRSIGVSAKYWGVSYRVSGAVRKELLTDREKLDLEGNIIDGQDTKFSAITEEQARKFHARYGRSAVIA
jgi:hypothetical protein